MFFAEVFVVVAALSIQLLSECAYIKNPAVDHALMRKGRRMHMEDRFSRTTGSCSLGDDYSLYGIFDGHGGSQVSQLLSETLPSAVHLSLCNASHQRDNRDRSFTSIMESAFKRTDNEILDQVWSADALTRGGPQQPGSAERPLVPPGDPGSTAVLALLLSDRTLVVANVGNSRALLCSSSMDQTKDPDDTSPNMNGYAHDRKHYMGELRPVPLSRPHELWQPDERKRILQAGGSITGGNGIRVARLEGDLELSRSFGDRRYRGKGLNAVPEVSEPLKLTEGDRLLILASDGLFEVMTSVDICAHAHAVATGRSHPAPSSPRPPPIALPPSQQPCRVWGRLVAAPLGFIRFAAVSLAQLGQQSLAFVCRLFPEAHEEDLPGAQAGNAGIPACSDCGATAPQRDRDRTDHPGVRGYSPQQLAPSCRAQAPRATGPETLAGAVAHRVIHEAYNRGSMDNLAVVVVDLSTMGHSGSVVQQGPQPRDQARERTGGPGNTVQEAGAYPSMEQRALREWDSPHSLLPLLLPGSRLVQNCTIAEEVCSWRLRSGGQEGAEGEGGDAGGLSWDTYILMDRISMVPSPSLYWHKQSWEGSNPHPTKPLELEALYGSWSGSLDLHLLPLSVPRQIEGPSSQAEPRGDGALAAVDPLLSHHVLLEWLGSVCMLEELHSILTLDDGDLEAAALGVGENSAAPGGPAALDPVLPLEHSPSAATRSCPSQHRQPIMGPVQVRRLDVIMPLEASVRRVGRGLLHDAADDDWVSEAVEADTSRAIPDRPSRPSRGEEGTEGLGGAGSRLVSRHRSIEPLGPRYSLHGRVGQGSFGEVWKGVQASDGQPCHDTLSKRCGDGGEEQYVLKRLLVERSGHHVRLSGIRENYFGELLQRRQSIADAGVVERRLQGGMDEMTGLQHLCRFVESFQTARQDASPGSDGDDLWLVFRDEGISLHDYMYAPVAPAGEDTQSGPHGSQQQQQHGDGSEQATAEDGQQGFQILGPSPWWQGLRKEDGGCATIRSLLRQLLLGLDALHALNITHRDVKPENMLMTRSSPRAGCGLSSTGPVGASEEEEIQGDASHCEGQDKYHLRLIDFGSAIDPYSLKHLYDVEGPSADELTLEYAPPEALFGRYWEGSAAVKPTAWAHDIWAVGVVWLELLLGTPHVFQLPAHTRSVLDAKLRAAQRSEGDRQLLYLLRGFMEWCIYPPQAPNKRRGRKEIVSWSCTEQAIMRLIKARDPTGAGIAGQSAVGLLLRILHWEPHMRPTAHQALLHAFFVEGGEQECAPFGHKGWC